MTLSVLSSKYMFLNIQVVCVIVSEAYDFCGFPAVPSCLLPHLGPPPHPHVWLMVTFEAMGRCESQLGCQGFSLSLSLGRDKDKHGERWMDGWWEEAEQASELDVF